MKALFPVLLLAAAPAVFAQPTAPAHCPQAGEQLAEYLAGARQRIGQDGDVFVAYDVDARGRTRQVSVDGTRRYRTPVRIAVNSLDCEPGTPQRYVLHIRFADRAPTLAASPAASPAAPASATLAQAASAP